VSRSSFDGDDAAGLAPPAPLEGRLEARRAKRAAGLVEVFVPRNDAEPVSSGVGLNRLPLLTREAGQRCHDRLVVQALRRQRPHVGGVRIGS